MHVKLYGRWSTTTFSIVCLPPLCDLTHTHNKFTGDYIAEVCDGNLKPLIVCYVVRHTVGVSYLPSSSDTSKTSVIVSGTFSLCFSVTVCEQNINNKYQQNIVSKPTHHVIMRKIIDSIRQAMTYCSCGDNFFSDYFQCVHHWDVAKAFSDWQSSVSILCKSWRQKYLHQAIVTTPNY